MNISLKGITLLTGYLLIANTLFAFNRQDSLRGGNGNGRNWWDVQHYELQFSIDTATRSVRGSNRITFIVPAAVKDSMQIDLQEPMVLDSARYGHIPLSFSREGNVYWLTGLQQKLKPGKALRQLDLFYHGSPRVAVRPPWDGGFIWTRDSMGKPWISVACQGLGASSWWPCKDSQEDEPDKGVKIFTPEGLGVSFISNGQEGRETKSREDSLTGKSILQVTKSWWSVRNPINTYDVTFYAGNYRSHSGQYNGLKGSLNINFRFIPQTDYSTPDQKNEALKRVRPKYEEARRTIEALEHWFGPYPFYEDGYKLVEAPFLGMEHQSAVAYGNLYMQGYRGKDRSGTGIGLLFDFIIVHESGHEWFGNSVTAADIADNWIHEGFTTYSETLFTEYWFGKEKAFEYCRGEWKNISNDRPVIGNYGVNDAGSGDKYDKGSALVHTIRLLMNNDERFRGLLHAICDTFYHKQITSAQMESFISRYSGLSLQAVFDQYLRSKDIPELEYVIHRQKLRYRFNHIVPGFSLPVKITINGSDGTIKPTAAWQELNLKKDIENVSIPPGFLIQVKEQKQD